MKRLLCFLAAILPAAHAEPVTSILEWRPACDGSSIEVVSDQRKIVSVRASAFHSEIIAEWSIHYSDGHPLSAEYRESGRGKLLKGERAGEYSGENPVKLVQTWVWNGDGFPVKNAARAEELAEILTRVGK